MDIEFDSMFTRCQELSSFEGRRLTDGQGNSMYEQAHITDQDKPLIQGMVRKAVEMANSRLSSSVGEIGFSLTTSQQVQTGALKLLEEIVAAYVMYLWLEDKSKERSDCYLAMTEQMMSAFRSRVRPTLMDDY